MNISALTQAEINATQMTGAAARQALQDFIGKRQLRAMLNILSGEEGDFFREKFRQIAYTSQTMPETYDTRDIAANDKVVHLHYFGPNYDAWIVEKDSVEGDQALGFSRFSGSPPELGYINIREIIENHIELDLYWTPKKWSEIQS